MLRVVFVVKLNGFFWFCSQIPEFQKILEFFFFFFFFFCVPSHFFSNKNSFYLFLFLFKIFKSIHWCESNQAHTQPPTTTLFPARVFRFSPPKAATKPIATIFPAPQFSPELETESTRQLQSADFNLSEKQYKHRGRSLPFTMPFFASTEMSPPPNNSSE